MAEEITNKIQCANVDRTVKPHTEDSADLDENRHILRMYASGGKQCIYKQIICQKEPFDVCLCCCYFVHLHKCISTVYRRSTLVCEHIHSDNCLLFAHRTVCNTRMLEFYLLKMN